MSGSGIKDNILTKAFAQSEGFCFESPYRKITVTHQKPNIRHRLCGYFKKISTFDG